MFRRPGWTGAFILLLASTLAAQDRTDVTAGGGDKRARAVRVPDGAIELDGRLAEEVWQGGVPITDFIQKEPEEGALPTERMEVHFLYDDGALYIGARMFSRTPTLIQAPMGRRDNGTQAEHILVSLDTFLDHRTAHAFGVTASGVRLDRFYPADDETAFDEGFDPVWEARTTIDALGWTAELRIPFSQLRFNERPEHVWGLNIQRFTPTLNEDDYWVVVPRTQKGWSSHFGQLGGIQGLRSTRRLEAVPYVAGSSVINTDRVAGNPFQSARDLSARVGADVKMGLGPSLTLDATVNPDFGQVEADPAEVNLTAFPTRFAEKRPFFTEGSQLLTIAHQNVFYSRRIGARPSGPAPGDYVDYPAASTILAAGKVTGRLSSGTSVGLLTAVTDEEVARISTIGSPVIATRAVAARTVYTVAHVQQEFGPSASTVSGIVTFVHRDLPDDSALSTHLPRTAMLVGGDALLRFSGGQYEAVLAGVGTFVRGDAAAIEGIQRSSAHYMQRPDRDYAVLDPTRTSLVGYSMITTLRKTGGRHWLWSFSQKTDSPGFESNDVGRLTAADSVTPTLELRYRETRPGRIFRNYSAVLQQANEWSYGGERVRTSLLPSLNVTWLNFWTTSLSVARNLRAENILLTRGGPRMGTPAGWSAALTLANSVASRTRVAATSTVAGNEDHGFTRRLNASVAFRPGPRWELTVTPTFEHLVDTQQYVSTLGGGRPDTFGRRYVFAAIDRRTYSSQYRLNFTFRPDLNLDMYAEPFTSSGRYEDYGELLQPGARTRLAYGSSGTTLALQSDGRRLVMTGPGAAFTLANNDFNVRSFRSNLVLRWEWHPGSTLYVVWQQDRFGSEAIGTPVNVGDMFRSATAPGANYFIVKTAFWLPVK